MGPLATQPFDYHNQDWRIRPHTHDLCHYGLVSKHAHLHGRFINLNVIWPSLAFVSDSEAPLPVNTATLSFLLVRLSPLHVVGDGCLFFES